MYKVLFLFIQILVISLSYVTYSFKILSLCISCLSVQLLSCVWLFATPWTVAHQASPSITKLLGLAQTHVHRVGDAIQPSHPLSSPSPPAFNLSQHCDLFKWVSSLHQVEYWSFGFNISPSNEYSRLISFRMDWLDLLAVWGTLKKSSPIPQFKSINSSVLSFLYSPVLTSIHHYWKKHSFD